MNEAQRICQRIADTHYVIAAAEDHLIAGSGLPVYDTSQRLFLAAIRQAYGLTALKAHRVYDVWVDSSEPVADCVEYVRANRVSRAYTR
jgi:hypothetical protein